MSLEARKLKLIKEISEVESEVVLKKLEALLEAVRQQEKLLKLAKPMRKTTNLEAIAKEQGYDPHKGKALKGKWPGDESLDELLSLLD